LLARVAALATRHATRATSWSAPSACVCTPRDCVVCCGGGRPNERNLRLSDGHAPSESFSVREQDCHGAAGGAHCRVPRYSARHVRQLARRRHLQYQLLGRQGVWQYLLRHVNGYQHSVLLTSVHVLERATICRLDPRHQHSRVSLHLFACHGRRCGAVARDWFLWWT